MPSCTILMNARAGLHQDTATPEQMRHLVDELALDAEVVETQSRDHMCETIRRLQTEHRTCIAVAGGDGTIHEAVQCIACTETVLGVIPQGTRNNFAHALGLPIDLREALMVLKEGDVRAVDLGRAEGVFFTEAAGVGLFADALAAYGDTNKNFWKGIYAIATIFFSMRAKRLRLTVDGNVISEKAVMCTIANGYRLGASVPIAPDAKVADGELDVVVLGDLGRLELVPYYKAMKKGEHLALEKVSKTRGKEIRIETAIPIAVHVDDQVVGRTPVTVRVVPQSLKVLVKQE